MLRCLELSERPKGRMSVVWMTSFVRLAISAHRLNPVAENILDCQERGATSIVVLTARHSCTYYLGP